MAGWLGGWAAGWLGGWVAGRLGGWAAGAPPPPPPAPSPPLTGTRPLVDRRITTQLLRHCCRSENHFI